jgi:ParB-like chromosome segregation protein Spo0J
MTQLTAAVLEYQVITPLIIDQDGVVIGGHLRLE